MYIPPVLYESVDSGQILFLRFSIMGAATIGVYATLEEHSVLPHTAVTTCGFNASCSKNSESFGERGR